jgi:hypothetical protein
MTSPLKVGDRVRRLIPLLRLLAPLSGDHAVSDVEPSEPMGNRSFAEILGIQRTGWNPPGRRPSLRSRALSRSYDLPLDMPLWLERAEIAEEQRLAHIAANDLPEDWEPDPEDAAPWWRAD